MLFFCFTQYTFQNFYSSICDLFEDLPFVDIFYLQTGAERQIFHSFVFFHFFGLRLSHSVAVDKLQVSSSRFLGLYLLETAGSFHCSSNSFAKLCPEVFRFTNILLSILPALFKSLV